MSKIRNIHAREIIDSRGNPTVEVDVTLENGITATASVPSGASTGVHEALELRDNDSKRYNGKGVLQAVKNVNEKIFSKLKGMDALNQKLIDQTMIELDGTESKTNLGANAMLGVSLAVLKAGAKFKKEELYAYLGDKKILPRCMMNILNGGAHAENKLEFQEFMIIPSKEEYLDNLRMGVEVFHSLQKILKEKGLSCGVGDEGGFAPSIDNTKKALDLIQEAIEKADYKLGSDIFIGLDVAASEFYKDGYYNLEGQKRTSDEMIDYYEDLISKYPIISIEDGLDQDDYIGWQKLTKRLGDKLQLVGDDLFVTNKKLLQKGIDLKMANAILLKLNQIGTVTETLETIKLAQENGYKTIISHRSGETEDNYIADFAVGLGLGQIKTGSMSRSERISKYNRLIRINEQITTK
jgi:enolase